MVKLHLRRLPIFWAPMIGLVCQLAARWPQVAHPRRLPLDLAFLMVGLVGQLPARHGWVVVGAIRCNIIFCALAR